MLSMNLHKRRQYGTHDLTTPCTSHENDYDLTKNRRLILMFTLILHANMYHLRPRYLTYVYRNLGYGPACSS